MTFRNADSRNPAGRADDWVTPRFIIEALGPFDLDPCSSEARPWDTATRSICPPGNGLIELWGPKERVWLNPPYTHVYGWVRRLADHGNGTALVFARTDTFWFHDQVFGRAVAILFLKKRLSFLRPDGTPKLSRDGSPMHAGAPSCLVAYDRPGKIQVNKVRLQLAVIGGDLKGYLVSLTPERELLRDA